MKRASMLISALIAGAVLLFTLPTSAQRTLAPPLNFIKQFVHAGQSQSSAPQGRANRRLPQTREDFDVRANLQRALDVPATEVVALDPSDPGRRETMSRTVATQSALKRSRPSAQMKWSSLTNAPSRIWSFSETLTASSDSDAEIVARRFLKNNDDLFHLGSSEVDGLRISRRYRTEHNGVTHVTLQQQVNGIEVFQADFAVHVDRAGAVLAASGELLPLAERSINLAKPGLAAAEALQIAARDVENDITGPLNLRVTPTGADERQAFDRAAGFARDVEAKLVYFPVATDQLRLSWELILWMRETPDVYLMVIDAERGSLLYRFNFTQYEGAQQQGPHGMVFTRDSPRPDSPHTNTNPATVEREDVPFRPTPFNGADTFAPNDSHYDWWAGQPANGLISNNTDTHLDRDNMPNLADLPRLTVTDGNFAFPIDFTQAPTTENNQKAAQVNLFYWLNRYHDILYKFGFTEAAGNFQTNNFTFGGRGNDAIQADAQDGGGMNNANFSSPPDGNPGRVQMYLWTGTPLIDGDFDQHVIIHELTHGLSTRLVFNSSGLTGIQSRSMGEGWSDWFGLVLTRRESDDINGSYPVGQYVRNNYARGIRRFPYSTSMTTYPYTFKDVALNTEVHAAGEIWCNALWEMRAALIQRYGFQEGQRQSIQLVVDGLKMTPRAPSFVDARNAILLADRANNGGANQCMLWQAFAKRGLGFDANTTDADDGAPAESRDAAPYCSDLGTLRLDKSQYVVNESVRVALGDRNAGGTIMAQVSSSITGDRETITLAQESGIQGSFLGSVKLASGRAKAGDGILQGSSEAGDEVVITYEDANSGSGVAGQARATAVFSREKAFLDDTVETGNQGWIASGTWAITNTRAASPTRCWTDTPGGRYPTNSNFALTSPLLDLTNLSEVTLAFAHSYEFPVVGLDFGVVEFSTDDGATWKRASAVTGAQTTFIPARFRMRGLDGQARARVRFRLQTVSNLGDGWYVDDIRVLGRSTRASVIPPNSTQPPAIAGITPAFGPPAGGARVTITGANFTESDDTTVTFDGIPAAAVNVLGGNAITAVAPPHAAGAVTVAIANRQGASTLVNGFTYYTPGGNPGAPTLTSLYPNFGSVRGGTVVTLVGANFTPETIVNFGTRRGAATFVNVNTLRVVTPFTDNAGAVDVTAVNGANQNRLTNGFNYISPSPPAVAVQKPAGGETLFAGSVYTIRWISADNRAVAAHRISLYRATTTGLQFVSDIATVGGEEQSFNWTIPTNVPIADASIRVRATDDEGTETEAYSTGNFALARRWEVATPLPTPATAFAPASDGRYLYAIGGLNLVPGLPTVTTARRLDTTAQNPQWAEIAPIPTGLNSIDGVFLKGKIYVPGGFNASNQLVGQHFAYDVATDTWETKADVPLPIAFYALVADDARGVYYYVGSIDTATATGALRSYDPNTNAWTNLPPMSALRLQHEAALIEDKLYVAGGSSSAGGLASAEVFDFATRQWSPIAPMSRPRIGATNFVTKDPAGNPLWFIVGGSEPGTVTVLGAEVYDVRNNRWIMLDGSFSLPTPRSLAAGATVDNFFYAYGGISTTTGIVNERIRADVIPSLIPFDVAPALAVPVAQVAVPNVEIRFNVTANDLGSGVPLTLSASDLPSGASFDTTTETNNSVRGSFRWTPAAADVNKTFTVSFTVSDGQLSETKLVSVRVVEASRLAAVNSADFRSGPIAADSIAAIFGSNLAVRNEAATATPLPLSLAGTTVTVNGVQAQLFFVSPGQVNFAVPPSIEPGMATIIVSNPAGVYAAGTVEIVAAAPALFTINATGSGDAAALATVDGVTFQQPPFDVVVGGRPNNLILYGIGFRRAPATNPNDENGVAESVNVTIDGRQARVLYAGAQGTFTGLDQLNVEMPASLAGGGLRRVEVVVMVNNVAANRVTIQIR